MPRDERAVPHDDVDARDGNPVDDDADARNGNPVDDDVDARNGNPVDDDVDARRDTADENDAEGDHCSVDLDIPDMDCPSCARKVEARVETVDGVTEIDPRPTTGTLSVGYDPRTATPDDVQAGVEAAGYEVTGRSLHTVRFAVPEMDCASCASKVDSALEGNRGITAVDTRPMTGSVVVTYDDQTDAAAIADAIESAGYEVTATDGDDGSAGGATDAADTVDSVWRSRRAKKTYLGAVLLAFALVANFVYDGLWVIVALGATSFTVADVAFLAATAFAGQEILQAGYYSAKNRQLDIDFLMTAAIVAAITASVGFGEHLYFEAATLAVLFSVSELLEGYAMDRTRNSLRELVELSPDEATVKRADGTTETIPVDDLRVGDVVVVKPGEQVPADGVVVDGASAIDEAPVTGESTPVDKTTGDDVYAGTINAEGFVEVEVTTPPGEDTLSRIVELVEAAQSNQTEREQFVERFAGYYTPLMVTVAIAVAVVPPVAFGAPWTPWFVNGITMLVLACPCAFVISTPVSVVSGVTSAARNGVLVKGGNHLEAMGSVDAIAMDKTGTLTKGELTVTDVIPIGDRSVQDVLRCARGLESRSEHPIADAIVAHADGHGDGVEAHGVDDFESVTGKGVQAAVHGETHYAGKPAWFDDLGFDLEHAHVLPAAEPGGSAGTVETTGSAGTVDSAGTAGTAETADSPEPTDFDGATNGGVVSPDVRDLCERQGCVNLADDTIPRLQREGKTVVLVGTEDEIEGLVAVADEIRPDAMETVAALQAHGLDVVMLTGDNEGTARAVAESVGIDDYRGGLLPEDKVDAVRELTERYDGVAMVGDGINDAPALATATVGIAMGAAGTDTAIETADIALMSDDISNLPYIYDLSHQANGVIRQNIYASLGIKALLAVGVPLGYVSVALAVLAGDAGMTMAVTGNALRLGRISPDD